MTTFKALPSALCTISLLALAACAKPSEADCAKMADHVTDIMVNEVTKDEDIEGLADAVREEAEKERPKLIEQCQTGTKAEVDCILKAQSMQDIGDC